MNLIKLSSTHENILHRIEREHEEDPVWIVGPKTGRMLYWLTRVVEPKNILEIGTSVGYSGIWLAAALEANGTGTLWTIESHKERHSRAQDNFKEAGLEHMIQSIRGHAPEVFDEYDLPEQIDLAFFDATKKEHDEFFDAVFPRMKSGSMIIADNVMSHRFGDMQKFIDRVHGDKNLKVVEIPVGDGLLIARVV
jgi:predicted O-methyltransferase YrrM